MRLIDADRLKRQIEGRSYRAKNKFIEMIDEQPTINYPIEQIKWERDIATEQLNSIGKGLGETMDDVQPVKTGKWGHEIRNTIDSLHTYQQFRCSICGMTYITNTPYCPNCGARMENNH